MYTEGFTSHCAGLRHSLAILCRGGITGGICKLEMLRIRARPREFAWIKRIRAGPSDFASARIRARNPRIRAWREIATSCREIARSRNRGLRARIHGSREFATSWREFATSQSENRNRGLIIFVRSQPVSQGSRIAVGKAEKSATPSDLSAESKYRNLLPTADS